MQLGDWLKERHMTREQFAALVGTHHSSVTRYINDGRMPRREVLARIKDVTGGQVTANDFMGQPAEGQAGEQQGVVG